MQEYTVRKITSENNLLEIVDFLKDGFNQSDLFASKMKKYVLLSNKKINFYGFSLLKNNDLKGAILTPLQGYFKEINRNNIPIYNLSSWYVKPESRGLPSIKHINYVTNYLSNCFITDYTPKKDVIPILQRLGFKSMQAVTVKKYIPSFKSLIKRDNLDFKQINGSNLENIISFKMEISNLTNVLFFSINYKNLKPIYFGGIVKYTKLKNLPIKSFYILWNSNCDFIYKNIDQINFYLLKKLGTLCIYIYGFKKSFNQTNKNKNHFRENNFFLKGPKDVDYITPLSSELSIGQI